jgi:hypothetical protein
MRDVLAQQFDLARSGRVEPAHQVQQRALAGARGADDGQRFAGMHVEVDAVQHCQVEPAFVEALRQSTCLQNHITHSAGPRQG